MDQTERLPPSVDFGSPRQTGRHPAVVPAMMGIATILFVIAAIVAASRFAIIFKELGIQIPRLSGWTLAPTTHVVVGILMLGVSAGCLLHGWRSWAIGAWIVALLLYGLLTITGFFMPLMITIEHLGSQP